MYDYQQTTENYKRQSKSTSLGRKKKRMKKNKQSLWDPGAPSSGQHTHPRKPLSRILRVDFMVHDYLNYLKRVKNQTNINNKIK